VTERSHLVGHIGIDEFEFSEALQLLRSYSLTEDVEGVESYTTHNVVPSGRTMMA
jgi:hypothetical protein